MQAGETLTIIAEMHGVKVEELVALNDIENPDLILEGQALTVSMPLGWTPVPTVQPSVGPLAFTWSLVEWRPDDPNYIAVLTLEPQGGQPPYMFYHDGLVQEGDTFEIAWRRCRPRPGSVGVADATGTYIKEDYWLLAPFYLPIALGVVQ